MNPRFLVLVLLISFSTLLVFADSNDDIDLLLNNGIDSFNLEGYEQAISYFDKVLEIDPNNIEALIGKGISLNQANRGLEAMEYFTKVLEIDPDYDIMKRIPHELAYSLFVKIDGHAEIMVYDSQDRLVTYLINKNLQVLNIKPAYDMIYDWTMTKTVNRNGQDFIVHQNLHTMTSEVPKIVGKNEIKADLGDYTPEEGIISAIGDEIVLFRYIHPQFLLQPGDTVYTVFTIFEPVE